MERSVLTAGAECVCGERVLVSCVCSSQKEDYWAVDLSLTGHVGLYIFQSLK